MAQNDSIFDLAEMAIEGIVRDFERSDAPKALDNLERKFEQDDRKPFQPPLQGEHGIFAQGRLVPYEDYRLGTEMAEAEALAAVRTELFPEAFASDMVPEFNSGLDVGEPGGFFLRPDLSLGDLVDIDLGDLPLGET